MTAILPEDIYEDVEDSTDDVMPTLTYDERTGLLRDDDELNMMQAIDKILRTEYDSEDYWVTDYGILLEDLIGQSPSVIRATLPQRITDALMQDDRVLDVANFEVADDTSDTMAWTFLVSTIHGDMEVSYAI